MRHPTRFQTWLLSTMCFVAVLCVGCVALARGTLANVDVMNSTVQAFEASVEAVALRNGYADAELHLVASIPVAALGAQLALTLFPRKTHAWSPLALGLGLGIVPGLAKELYDMTQPNNRFSVSDLGYDCLGVALGVGLVYSIRLLTTHMRREPNRFEESRSRRDDLRSRRR